MRLPDMRLFRSADTGPERAVRSALHRAGARFRKNVRGLPGTPDIVLPRRRAIVFVHGCFWHAHRCRGGRVPRSNAAFWQEKFERNRRRDRRDARALRARGWRVFVVWECELEAGTRRVARALGLEA